MTFAAAMYLWRRNDALISDGLPVVEITVAAIPDRKFSGKVFRYVLLGPLLWPYDPLEQQILSRLVAPSLEHPLGTDQFGRDLYSRLLYGARPTLLIVALVMIAGLLGVPTVSAQAIEQGRAEHQVAERRQAHDQNPARDCSRSGQ